MALLTPQAIKTSGNGLTPAYTTPSSSDTFPNDGKTFLHVKNAAGSSITVTITSTAVTPTGTVVAPLVETVGATTGDKMIGPLPPGAYNDPVTGLVTATYSSVTSVTAAVIQLPS